MLADEPVKREVPSAAKKETLADVALVYDLVERMNEVCARLKLADVEVSFGGADYRDPLAQRAQVSITLHPEARQLRD